MLRRHGLITEWYDRDIDVGMEWRDEIARQLEAADVIVLLVSADFLASDFCYEEEMLRAMERADRGDATLVGVMLRPVDGWEMTPFAKFQLLPQNGRPVSRWSNTDEAYRNVAAGIRLMLEDRVRSETNEEIAVRANLTLRDTDLVKTSAAAARATEIRAELNELLAQENGFVIVQGDIEANYYTQSFAEGGAFWCEAPSNDVLEAVHVLERDQTSRLVALGWNPPRADTPNWWCIQEDAESAAALMVRTLSEVYGVALDVPFQIERGRW